MVWSDRSRKWWQTKWPMAEFILLPLSVMDKLSGWLYTHWKTITFLLCTCHFQWKYMVVCGTGRWQRNNRKGHFSEMGDHQGTRLNRHQRKHILCQLDFFFHCTLFLLRLVNTCRDLCRLLLAEKYSGNTNKRFRQDCSHLVVNACEIAGLDGKHFTLLF